MLFEKPSLRTRVSFEVAMTQLGGHALFLSQSEVQLGQREAICDFARVLCRYVECIMRGSSNMSTSSSSRGTAACR